MELRLNRTLVIEMSFTFTIFLMMSHPSQQSRDGVAWVPSPCFHHLDHGVGYPRRTVHTRKRLMDRPVHLDSFQLLWCRQTNILRNERLLRSSISLIQKKI